MKKAVILHGTDGSPNENWFPWLKQKLESQGYEVWAPQLPDSHTPNKKVWGDFLFKSNWDFTDSIIVGHSAGGVEVLNLLMDERCPKVKLAICVGAWAEGYPNGDEWDDGQFDNMFPSEGFDFDLIKQKAERIEFIHGDDDPYCPLDQAKYLANKLNAPIKIVPGAGHFSDDYLELPEVWELIEEGV